MSFGEALATCFRKYSDFNGRASRAEYWWFFLFYVLAIFGLALLVGLSHSATPFLLVLGLILPQIAVAVRRLHDTGKPGTWYLITLIPYVGPIWLIVLLAQKGEPGPNQYGPPVIRWCTRVPTFLQCRRPTLHHSLHHRKPRNIVPSAHELGRTWGESRLQVVGAGVSGRNEARGYRRRRMSSRS